MNFALSLSNFIHTTCINITYPKILEETFLTKVLHCSVLNHIYQHEITEITCWTELFFI